MKTTLKDKLPPDPRVEAEKKIKELKALCKKDPYHALCDDLKKRIKLIRYCARHKKAKKCKDLDEKNRAGEFCDLFPKNDVCVGVNREK